VTFVRDEKCHVSGHVSVDDKEKIGVGMEVFWSGCRSVLFPGEAGIIVENNHASSRLIAAMFCAMVNQVLLQPTSKFWTVALNSCPALFPSPLLCEASELCSATHVLCILHWKEEGLEILFQDNYDHLQPLSLLREGNVKKQPVGSACGVMLITDTW